jgi:kinetochore protein Nuf2
MAQPAFTGLKALSFPEMHEDSVPFLNTFRACSKMMEICAVDDFSIKDFMAPSKERLRKHLSAIINFMRYKEEKENIIHELSSTTQQYIEKSQKIREKYETTSHRLALLVEKTSEEANIIIKLESSCKEIETVITALNNQQADIREESAELKSRNSDLKDAIADKAVQYDECVNTKKKLSAQIVNSPER